MLKKRFSIVLRKIPIGVEKTKMKIKSNIKPYCSSIIIVSVLMGKKVNKILEPSSGGNGIKLKKASSTFQKITIVIKVKKIPPKEPAIKVESCSQFPIATLTIISPLIEAGKVIIFPRIAAIKARAIFEPGPPRATNIGPNF